MRIGLIAPPWVPVPPPAYGGIEVVVDNLARGLAHHGHDVRLFTVGSAACPVTREYLYPGPVAPIGDASYEAAHTLAAYEALAEVDLIHDHTELGVLLGGREHPRVPVAVTAHGPFTPEARRIFAAASRRAAVIAISRSQARSAAPVPISAVIHHEIDLDIYRPGPGGGGYLLFIGRMSPDKGVHRAIRVARRAGMPLEIVTKMRDAGERAYFEEVVSPLLGPGDPLPAERSLAERLELLHHAEALLNPIRWPEPFGLVMAEALAAGVPVLAFPSGAAPEIVESGRTGFLCGSEDEMVAAVARLPELDRAACRASAEHRFGLDRMIADHERVYERVLAAHHPRSLPHPAAVGHDSAAVHERRPHRELLSGRRE
jgi:glycosyltransferase involved in cell wall biosynthesis